MFLCIFYFKNIKIHSRIVYFISFEDDLLYFDKIIGVRWLSCLRGHGILQLLKIRRFRHHKELNK